MNTRIKLALISTIFSCFSIISYAQDKWTDSQKEVVETMTKLSETTAPEGKGADEYRSFLSDDFNRWTIGRVIFIS